VDTDEPSLFLTEEQPESRHTSALQSTTEQDIEDAVMFPATRPTSSQSMAPSSFLDSEVSTEAPAWFSEEPYLSELQEAVCRLQPAEALKLLGSLQDSKVCEFVTMSPLCGLTSLMQHGGQKKRAGASLVEVLDLEFGLPFWLLSTKMKEPLLPQICRATCRYVMLSKLRCARFFMWFA